MSRYGQAASALVCDALGVASVLIAAAQEWQTVTVPRGGSFPDVTAAVSGRAVDGAPTALALVALAGTVAVLVTRGRVRRSVGALIGLAGVAVVLRSLVAIGSISVAHALRLVSARHYTVDGADMHAVRIATHPLWAVLSAVGGVLVAAGGALVAWRGGRWAAMSARYEPAGARREHDGEQARATTLWAALDRGEDPTG